jgi:hypothetical protein
MKQRTGMVQTNAHLLLIVMDLDNVLVLGTIHLGTVNIEEVIAMEHVLE